MEARHLSAGAGVGGGVVLIRFTFNNNTFAHSYNIEKQMLTLTRSTADLCVLNKAKFSSYVRGHNEYASKFFSTLFIYFVNIAELDINRTSKYQLEKYILVYVIHHDVYIQMTRVSLMESSVTTGSRGPVLVLRSIRS